MNITEKEIYNLINDSLNNNWKQIPKERFYVVANELAHEIISKIKEKEKPEKYKRCQSSDCRRFSNCNNSGCEEEYPNLIIMCEGYKAKERYY